MLFELDILFPLQLNRLPKIVFSLNVVQLKMTLSSDVARESLERGSVENRPTMEEAFGESIPLQPTSGHLSRMVH